jgi:hypothetical protein
MESKAMRALVHTSLVHDFLTKTGTTAIPHQPYLLNLVPSDFFLFPKLKSTLRE